MLRLVLQKQTHTKAYFMEVILDFFFGGGGEEGKGVGGDMVVTNAMGGEG